MLAFIHISKTGGTTVTYILRSTFGPGHCQVEPWHDKLKEPPFSSEDLERLRKIYPNLRSIAGHRIKGYVDLHDNGTEFKYFTLMRDPLKRHASYYQFKAQERGLKDNFEEWIVKSEWSHNRQTRSIASVVDANEAIRIIQEKNIFIGLTDRFDESMVLLKALMARELNISYKRVQVAPRNTIAQSLLSTERTRQMFVDANRADLELYDYVTHELYPAYQRAYGPSLEADVAEYRRKQSHNFNYWKLTMARLKQYSLYRPLLYLNRKGVRVV
jgi:hypothetical protein